MAILLQSTAIFSSSFLPTRNHFTRLTRSPCFLGLRFNFHTRSFTRRRTVSSGLYSSKSLDVSGSVSPDNDDAAYELYHDFSSQRQSHGSPIFVMLPEKSVGQDGNVVKQRAVLASMRVLAATGVEGVVVEIWWGMVKRNKPRAYEWRGYTELVTIATCGLKVRVVLAFHQQGTRLEDASWIPLPLWVSRK